MKSMTLHSPKQDMAEKTQQPSVDLKIPQQSRLTEDTSSHQDENLSGTLSQQLDSTSGSSTRTSVDYDDEGRPTPSSGEVAPAPLQRIATSASVGPPFSVFSKNQKRFIVFMASWAGFFSPVSSNIYFPALNALAEDLNVSDTLINLTLTSYMIFQGLAPAFIGSLADSMGRRPAYTICFIIYIVANIGLALQNSYAALFVLRCLQSTGSSATIAMASAVVADVATPAERGAYMGFTLGGSLLGPAIGPVLGGILAEFLGWRSIFWFLAIFAAAFLAVFLAFFPETARGTVGNGSIPPQGWNMSLMNYLAIRKARKVRHTIEDDNTVQREPNKKKFRFPNPLASLIIILDKQNALLLFYNAFLFAAFYDITAVIPSQFAEIYHFNELQIGLCYIPFGFGSMAATLTNGQLLDRNFARWCRKLNIPIRKGRDQDLRDFPIEKVRLQIAIPTSYVASIIVLIFGWVLDINGPLAAILVLLFIGAFSMSIAFNVTSTLLVDMYPKSPATATAANNLVRCLLGAGATGVVVPMINGMGRGWTFTFLTLFLLITSPMIWANYFYGMEWREQRRVKDERKRTEREARKAGKIEQGNEKHEGGRPEEQKPPAEGGEPELAAVAEEDREHQEQHGRSNTEPKRGGRHGPKRPSANAKQEGLYRARSHEHTH
ncbi:hypothetical protein H2198_005193 [Neophaeococcomyces mojaviensis]|uniref:Uncharacterized protein n=1 Tax=Neophaeococcomyces mojaviensis TaxID=3383035 RepID=A0ACC3A6S9_9EURO|nr:hypothetical protein H2198_005193 [Knufia sp. JES_112]